MKPPRFTSFGYLVPLAALVLGLLAVEPVRAEPGPRDDSSDRQIGAPEEAGQTLTDEQRRRTLAILFSTMILSGEYPPPEFPPPLVNKAPHRSPRWKVPHHGGAGGTPTTASTSPEPASMATGLMGSGIACVYAWLRKRRARREVKS